MTENSNVSKRPSVKNPAVLGPVRTSRRSARIVTPKEEKKTPLKRKHKTLSIQEKVHLLKLLDEGKTVGQLCELFCIGSSTIYDIKKKKDDLLKFYAERQSKKGVAVRKTMKEGKCSELERALVKWFEERRGEGETVTGGMLVEQARILHKEMKMNFECKYSHGWLDKFKTRHGIKLCMLDSEEPDDDSQINNTLMECSRYEELLIPDESNSEQIFVKKFLHAVTSEELHPEQVYSANQTFLLWRQMPKEIFSSESDQFNSHHHDTDSTLAVFSCFNATGTHRCKLLVVGKSPKPEAFEGVNVLPVIYRANEQSCVTREILIEWLEDHFTAEAKKHCISLGLAENSKIFLILDSKLAPSNEEFLVIDNVHMLFLTFDPSIPLQPQDQGISRWLKWWYRLEYMTCYLEAVIKDKSGKEFDNEFNVKDFVWALARAWENISETSLRQSWHKIWPDLIYEVISEKDISETYAFYKQQVINHVLDHLKTINSDVGKDICYQKLEEWMEEDYKVSLVPVQEQETTASVMNVSPTGKKVNDCETNVISVKECIHLTSQLISGLEKQNFITEQDIMYLHRLKANLIAEKLKQTASETKKQFKSEKTKDKINDDEDVEAEIEHIEAEIEHVESEIEHVEANKEKNEDAIEDCEVKAENDEEAVEHIEVEVENNEYGLLAIAEEFKG